MTFPAATASIAQYAPSLAEQVEVARNRELGLLRIPRFMLLMKVAHAPARHRAFRGIALLLASAILLAGSAPAARAVSPDSPEVKAVVEKALKALETQGDDRLGGKCLMGMCFFKAGRPLTHHRIVEAIHMCKGYSPENLQTLDMYSLGIAIVFMCELEQQDLHPVIQRYLTVLLKRQKPHGGFGYDIKETGDTSQTQYAALALWMARNKGFEVPQENVEKLCAWLLRTQAPSGSWGYQGKDPGAYTRIPQESSERMSLLVAGLGSVYICADLLGINDVKAAEQARDTPSVLKEVVSPDELATRKDGASKVIDAGVLRKSLADGNQYFAKNYKFDIPFWKWYYIYGMERYLSYKELGERKKEREPKWYNDGFAFLLSTQLESGLWPQDEERSSISTCFAVLFLLRSSGKAVQKANPDLGEGTLLGRMGLPANTADIRERDGKIVETPLAGSIDELLALIEKPDHPELSQLTDTADALKLESDVTKRSGQIARLRAIVAQGSYDARLVAVKTLGKARDLDNVPVLIYALSDGDVRVVREADKALRFLSRKFQGVGLPDEGELKREDKQAAIHAWKSWYLSVRPDGEFLD